jgi:hypothetical protein
MTESAGLAAEQPVRYDPDGTADFTTTAKPVRWRVGDQVFDCLSDPPVDALVAWIGKARQFAAEMGRIGEQASGSAVLDGDDDVAVGRVREAIIALFAPVHTAESQARFAEAVADRKIGLRAVLGVIRWLPSQFGLGEGIPPVPSSGLSAGPPAPAGGSSSTDGPPSPASTSAPSPFPGSPTSPGR